MGFIFVLLMLYVTYRIARFLLAQPARAVQEHNQQQSSQQHYQTGGISHLYPLIDTLTAFATESQGWTSEKVKYIKWLLRHDLNSEQDFADLRERLKRPPQHTQLQLLSRLREGISSSNDAEFVVTVIGMILVLNRLGQDQIGERLLQLAQFFQLNQAQFDQVIDSVFQQLDDDAEAEQATHGAEQEQTGSSGYSDQDQHSSGREQASQSTHSTELFQACQTLGLEPQQLTSEAIQKAYRLKMKDYHPDRHPDLSPAIQALLIEKTQALNAARDLLMRLITR